jgi:hypothetical protein
MAENYQEQNNFKEAFFTNKEKFAAYSKFEIKRNGYPLLNAISKGFPNLVDLIINLKGFNWKAPESHAILTALQCHHFINGFSKVCVPQFTYFKSFKETKTKKEKAKKTENGLIFDEEIQQKIQSILFMDSKSYEYLKFSNKVQILGQQLLGEFQQTEKIKTSKSKKK